MALLVCTGCTTRYSVGAVRCPHCGSTEHVEEGQEQMPKITVHGGPSVAGASVVGGSWADEGDPDVWPEPAAAEEGDVEQDATEPADVPGYEDLTVEQMKEQLGERGLAKTGKRDDLVARLVEDDAARAADPETE
jgi:hypothetical protein